MPRRAAAPPRRSPQRREPLSRERVLAAALELADRSGIEALSMRTLAASLGVGTMSLYHHVGRKDDLIDAMLTVVYEEQELPPDELPWESAIHHHAVSAHQVLLRHRWAAATMMTRWHQGGMRSMEVILRRLREAGFSPEMAHHAYHAIDSHIVGFTLWIVGMDIEEPLPELAARVLPTLPQDRFPYLVEHIQTHLTPPTDYTGTEFEFGLELILDGLERMLPGPGPA